MRRARLRPVRPLSAVILGALSLSCAPEVQVQHPEREAARGDLPGIASRGVLRVLVPGLPEDLLQRRGALQSLDREMAAAFAQRLGVDCEFLAIESRKELLPLLEGGYGDLVIAQLTITPERRKRLRFTHPTAIVDEWLVGRKGDPDLPRSLEELEGREIHVRGSSSFAETLRGLSRSRGVGFRIVYVDEELDTETIVYQVSRGERPLTVVDGNLLDSIETYNHEVERLFVLASDRELAWVVRSDAPELASSLDTFLIERSLTGHRAEDSSTGDLDAIRSRGSLRVLTQNDPVHYFLHRGRQMGFDYEIAKLAARKLGVRLELVVPPSRSEIVEWLLDGRGDVVASTLAPGPEIEAGVAFSRPYLYLEERVIQSSSARIEIADPADLAGRTVHAWESPDGAETLEELGARIGALRVAAIPPEMDRRAVLDRVARGDFALALVDGAVLDEALSDRKDVEVALVLPGKRPIAFATRAGNPELTAFMDDFASDLAGSLELNDAWRRYFGRRRAVHSKASPLGSPGGRLSPYDDLLKKYSRRYGLDWRLMAAQAYQESRFDPRAVSWAGARGLFQLLPATGLELGFQDLRDPESGVHAGVRYMHYTLSRLEPRVPLKHRLRFALAAYNAGFGHLQDARRLAAEKGLDPDKWFGHAEKAMLWLSEPENYRRARYGYVRGTETVRYVSEIQNRYDHYVTLVPF